MKKVTILISVLALSITLTACKEKGPQEDPQTVINKAWDKLAEENADYQSGTVQVEGNGLLEFENSNGTLEGDAEVKFDTTDPENPRTAIKVDLSGDGSLEGTTGSFSLAGEIRTLEENTYILLENLSANTGNPQTDMMVNFAQNFFKNQWISLPNDLGLEGADDLLKNQQMNQKRIAEISKKHHFLEVEKDLGNRTYELRINPEKFKAYLIELSQTTDESLTEEDLAEIDEVINQLNYSLQVTIGEEYDLEWIKGSVVAQDPNDTDEMNFMFEGNISDDTTKGNLDLVISGVSPGKISLQFEAKHDDGSVSIEAPADAQPFDPQSLFGLGAPSDNLEGDLDTEL